MSAVHFNAKQAIDALSNLGAKLYTQPNKVDYYTLCNAKKYLAKHIEAQDIVIARLHETLTAVRKEMADAQPVRAYVEPAHNASDAARKTSNAGH